MGMWGIRVRRKVWVHRQRWPKLVNTEQTTLFIIRTRLEISSCPQNSRIQRNQRKKKSQMKPIPENLQIIDPKMILAKHLVLLIWTKDGRWVPKARMERVSKIYTTSKLVSNTKLNFNRSKWMSPDWQTSPTSRSALELREAKIHLTEIQVKVDQIRAMEKIPL